MTSGIPFPILRLTLLALAVLAQVYLFIRIRRAMRSSGRSDRFTTWTVRLAATVITLLFGLNAVILFRPIPWVDPPTVVRVGLFYLVSVWTVGSLLSAALLFLTQVAGILGRRCAARSRGQEGAVELRPADPGRRRFLKAGVGGIAAAPLVLSGYGAAYAGKAYEIEELHLPFGRSLKIVQLTDIHAGLYMTRDEMRRIANHAIALDPDLCVLTGDYISNSMAFLPGCVEEMARVRPRYGTFAVMGNHELWFGNPSETQALFRQHGIVFLDNAHAVIRTSEGPFGIVGIDDLRTGRPNLDAALRGLDPALPRLLLSHRPEIFPQAAGRGIRLTLSGHYHGGQIKLPLPGSDLSLAHLRSPYPEGLYRIGDSHLYVSRGIGTTFTPVRLNAPPEITLIHLS
jgi:hypothetical protein